MGIVILGSINWDSVAHVAELPRRGETVLSHRLVQSPGGKGLNQAVAAARFGAAVRLIGALGTDAPGRQLRAFLARGRHRRRRSFATSRVCRPGQA